MWIKKSIHLLRASLLLLFVMLGSASLMATHNRAGEITYQQIGDLTIRITITTYTQTTSTAADRDSLLVFWGDGTSEYVFRTNGGGKGEELPNNIKYNQYVADHNYPGRATYTVGFMDRNRVGNILNVNSPNSIEVPFFVQTTFTFLSPQTQGVNNSAVLLQPPVDFACVNEVFIHNPGAYDIDGDSLAYELGVPAMDANLSVPRYVYPDEIAPGPENRISLDPVTGDFVWDSPKVTGQYNIAIIIKEYRKGMLINSIVRDMQIRVDNCTKDGVSNSPPSIDAPDEICVVAGEVIDLDIAVNDLNVDSKVQISAQGGPFEVEQPAVFSPVDEDYLPVPRLVNLRWETRCEHIARYPYQIIIKAKDLFCDEPSLVTLKTIRVKVVGPPPENLDSESENGGIRLTWDYPYACAGAADNYFRGFSIWRKLSSEQITIDTCDPGLTGSGYEKIVFSTRTNDGITYSYIDESVKRGQTYCYRVQAEFAKRTASGQLYNTVESLPSNETCRQLARDLPLITHATVDATDRSNGTITVRYLEPLADDLDTVLYPGPYTFQLWHSARDTFGYSLVAGATRTTPSLDPITLREYTLAGLNTTDDIHFFRVEFYVNGGDYYGWSSYASSPYLSADGQDRSVWLDLRAEVPWNNYEYHIYRQDPLTGTFDSIAAVMEPAYVDENLTNGDTSCYLVKTVGNYGLMGTPDPLINWSNEQCATPRDQTPPCTPMLTVETICDKDIGSSVSGDLTNELSWTNPVDECNMPLDIQGYRIYYSPVVGQELELIAEVDDFTITEYAHVLQESIAGCYAILAYDDRNNESPVGSQVCVDNCPDYVLPNTFTPNADDANDRFRPRINLFVERVDFQVFNRWGNRVWQSTVSSLDWDGKDEGGQDLAEGTYFYTCRVFERRAEGVVEAGRLLRGNITIIR